MSLVGGRNDEFCWTGSRYREEFRVHFGIRSPMLLAGASSPSTKVCLSTRRGIFDDFEEVSSRLRL